MAEVMEIIVAHRGETEAVGGLIKAYRDFPWVSKTEDGEEYILREYGDVLSSREINGEPYERYGWYNFSWINPEYIRAVDDDSVYDNSGTEYYYCKVTMRGGKVYWLPDFWRNVIEDLKTE